MFYECLCFLRCVHFECAPCTHCFIIIIILMTKCLCLFPIDAWCVRWNSMMKLKWLPLTLFTIVLFHTRSVRSRKWQMAQSPHRFFGLFNPSARSPSRSPAIDQPSACVCVCFLSLIKSIFFSFLLLFLSARAERTAPFRPHALVVRKFCRA